MINHKTARRKQKLIKPKIYNLMMFLCQIVLMIQRKFCQQIMIVLTF